MRKIDRSRSRYEAPSLSVLPLRFPGPMTLQHEWPHDPANWQTSPQVIGQNPPLVIAGRNDRGAAATQAREAPAKSCVETHSRDSDATSSGCDSCEAGAGFFSKRSHNTRVRVRTRACTHARMRTRACASASATIEENRKSVFEWRNTRTNLARRRFPRESPPRLGSGTCTLPDRHPRRRTIGRTPAPLTLDRSDARVAFAYKSAYAPRNI
jgi:hypothetical protein